MFVKPAAGIVIRDPVTRRIIPVEGIEVEESGFWLRRVRDGDVNTVQTNQTDKREVSRKIK